MKKQRILIIGHGRHGKDTVAEMLAAFYGYTFTSSSQAAADLFLYHMLSGKYGYKTAEECYRDRHSRRDEWYDEISAYNKDDKAKLAKGILLKTDIYVGMRCQMEAAECIKQKLFDLVVGVYDPRKPLEETFKIDMWEVCDFVINNGSSLEDLKQRVLKLKPMFLPETSTWNELNDNQQLFLPFETRSIPMSSVHVGAMN